MSINNFILECEKENFKLKDKLEKQRKEYQETYKDVRIEIKEKDKEITRLNNIINELEKWLNEKWNKPLAQIYVSDVVKEINKLRGNSNVKD